MKKRLAILVLFTLFGFGAKAFAQQSLEQLGGLLVEEENSAEALENIKKTTVREALKEHLSKASASEYASNIVSRVFFKVFYALGDEEELVWLELLQELLGLMGTGEQSIAVLMSAFNNEPVQVAKVLLYQKTDENAVALIGLVGKKSDVMFAGIDDINLMMTVLLSHYARKPATVSESVVQAFMRAWQELPEEDDSMKELVKTTLNLKKWNFGGLDEDTEYSADDLIKHFAVKVKPSEPVEPEGKPKAPQAFLVEKEFDNLKKAVGDLDSDGSETFKRVQIFPEYFVLMINEKTYIDVLSSLLERARKKTGQWVAVMRAIGTAIRHSKVGSSKRKFIATLMTLFEKDPDLVVQLPEDHPAFQLISSDQRVQKFKAARKALAVDLDKLASGLLALQ